MTSLLQAAEAAKGQATQEIARLADLLAAAQAQTATLESQVSGSSSRSARRAGDAQDLADEITPPDRAACRARARGERGRRPAGRGAERAAAEPARGRAQPASRSSATASWRARCAAAQRVARSTSSSARRSDNEQREQRTQRADGAAPERRRRGGRAPAPGRGARSAAAGERARSAARARPTAEELQQAREQLLLELSQVRDRASELEAGLASEAGAHDARPARGRRARPRGSRTCCATPAAWRRRWRPSRRSRPRRSTRSRSSIARSTRCASSSPRSSRRSTSSSRRSRSSRSRSPTSAASSTWRSPARSRSSAASARSSSAGCASCSATGPDVRIVGDRFVFQSEVLFPTASANIEPGGRDELRKLADSLRLISAEIPSDLPWVLQINGHTDRRPISTPEFPSNWELSTARAINVGKFLIERGHPAGAHRGRGLRPLPAARRPPRRDRLPAQPPHRDQAHHAVSVAGRPPGQAAISRRDPASQGWPARPVPCKPASLPQAGARASSGGGRAAARGGARCP